MQICHDRACTMVEQTADVTGTHTAPTTLAPGVHFWRLYGRSDGTTGSAVSPTWEFPVGQRSAPVDTSRGTVADFNGDGYADLAVEAYEALSNTGRVYVYLGSASGLATTPATTFTAPDGVNGYFGYSVASVMTPRFTPRITSRNSVITHLPGGGTAPQGHGQSEHRVPVVPQLAG